MADPKLTPEYIAQQFAQADWLALQARGAAIAGDHERAKELRDQFDQLYDRLEALLDKGCEHD